MRRCSGERLTPNSTAQHVERIVAEAEHVVSHALLGLTEAYTPSLCLWRHQLGLPRAGEYHQLCERRCRRAADTAPMRLGAVRQLSEQARSGATMTHAIVNQRARLANISNDVSARSLLLIERSMAAYARVYAHATDVFMRRVADAEAESGTTILCSVRHPLRE
jgi:hypothetical protein